MKIKHRLLLAYFANTAVVFVFGFFSYHSNQQTLSEYHQLSEQSIPVLNALNEVRFSALHILSSTAETDRINHQRSAHAANADADAVGLEPALAAAEPLRLRRAVETYAALVERYFPEEAGFSTQIQQHSADLLLISGRFFKALEAQENAATLLALKAQMTAIEERFMLISQQALNYEAREIEERSVEVSRAITQHFMILVVGVCLILLIGALMTLSNGKYIASPLARLRDAADRVARGDLSVQVRQQSQDEMGELARAFNQMTLAHKEHKCALEAAYGYTENILYVMEDILITTDAEGVIKKVNRAACEQLGYPEAQLLGSPVARLLDNDDTAVTEFIPVNREGHFERNLRNSEGHRVAVLASLNQIGAGDPQHQGFLLIATNISARKLAEEKIYKLAFYDSLSGLPNRTLFNDRLQQAVKLAQRHKHHLAVLFMDIDNFKQINDSLGHDVGDELLCEISERLVQALRDSDVVAQVEHQLMAPTVSRHGGDEFVILLPYIAAPVDAGKIAERIKQQFSQGMQIKMQEIFTTLSIGIAIYPDNGSDSRLLLQNADTALYNAKANGKNQFSFFEAEMNSTALRRLDVENNLRYALANQELRLYYQPQLELDSGRVIGMEALLRWHHSDWGVVSPLEFIPVAESNGMIVAVGDWVLREACAQWRRWKDEGLDPGKISVNISALQFHDQDLFGKIKQIVRDSSVEPDALVLEITESVLMQDAEITLSQLHDIRGLGVRFAVDDFGTGYSSLSYLKTFPLDYLKIDRAFVRDLESSESDLEIVRTIIAMANNLQLRLVAEGVETPGQLRLLNAQNCTYMQGYLLSRPLPAEDYRATFLQPGRDACDGQTLCSRALGWKVD